MHAEFVPSYGRHRSLDASPHPSLRVDAVRVMRTPPSGPCKRSAWTLIDKVLNKALGYDARILHPESFSIVAERLDNAVRGALSKQLARLS